MPHPISRYGNNWLYYNRQYNCTIAYEHCPFDYCITANVSLNLNESDLQCTYNRSGTLCGQCQSELSLMLGSNQCGHCSNYYLFLLPLFILVGIGLIFMLLTLNLTVSVGTINLFYFLIPVYQYSLNSFHGLILTLVSMFASLMD